MEAAQTEHGDIGYWNRVTDVNYEDGQYCGTLQEPPTVPKIIIKKNEP